MRTRSIGTAATALALTVGGCDFTSPASKELAAFLLDFCSDETPAFVAFQNEGGPWTRATVDANGTVTMQVTGKFALAVSGEEAEVGPFTDVVYGTRQEFAALNGAACLEPFGTKTLNGSVSGVSTSQRAEVTLGRAYALVPGTAPSFQLLEIPDRLLDLVSHREATTLFAPPERVIVRRALSFTSGATLVPQLDFTSADFVVTSLLTITGLVAGESNTFSNEFSTLSGTSHTFHAALFNSTAATQSIYGVPAALTQSGDLHTILVGATASTGASSRGVGQFHRNPGDRAAALGPMLNLPTVTSAATTPSLRMRAQLTSQAEYGGFATANFFQSAPGNERNFSVTKTSGFLNGTPTTWDLEMPDLGGVTGFPAEAAFVNGVAVQWFMQAGSGGAEIIVGGPGTDGLAVTFADRSSAAPMLLSRFPGPDTPGRGRWVRSFSP